MKKDYLISGFLGIFILTACSHQHSVNDTVQTVKTDTVKPANELTMIQYPGKVKASEDINMAFKVSGTIQRMYAEEGARIRKGQLLAELDPTDYKIQLDATEAEYKQIKAEAERVMALYKEGGTTENANDKAVYGLKQITAKYNHHKEQLAYTKLYAPFDGYVQKHLFNAYETVGAGMPVISIIDNGQPDVEINLPAAEYIRREHFQSYHCTFDIYPGKAYQLEPVSVTPKANANQLYTMRLKLKEHQSPLPSPGMNTMVTILCDTIHNKPMNIPASAVLIKAGKTSVFKYNPSNGKVCNCPVNLLRLQSDGSAIVTSEHLKSGDIIVSSGVHHIQNGENVHPLTPTSKTNIGGML